MIAAVHHGTMVGGFILIAAGVAYGGIFAAVGLRHNRKRARYLRLAAAYRAAADLVGEHPRDFQAIVWLSVRPTAEHARDNETIGDLFA